MARTKQIDYERVTFSFPKATMQLLRLKVPKQNMSKFVAQAVQKQVKEQDDEVAEFMKELDELCTAIAANRKDNKSAVELIREIRYEGKY